MKFILNKNIKTRLETLRLYLKYHYKVSEEPNDMVQIFIYDEKNEIRLIFYITPLFPPLFKLIIRDFKYQYTVNYKTRKEKEIKKIIFQTLRDLFIFQEDEILDKRYIEEGSV